MKDRNGTDNTMLEKNREKWHLSDARAAKVMDTANLMIRPMADVTGDWLGRQATGPLSKLYLSKIARAAPWAITYSARLLESNYYGHTHDGATYALTSTLEEMAVSWGIELSASIIFKGVTAPVIWTLDFVEFTAPYSREAIKPLEKEIVTLQKPKSFSEAAWQHELREAYQDALPLIVVGEYYRSAKEFLGGLLRHSGSISPHEAIASLEKEIENLPKPKNFSEAALLHELREARQGVLPLIAAVEGFRSVKEILGALWRRPWSSSPSVESAQRESAVNTETVNSKYSLPTFSPDIRANSNHNRIFNSTPSHDLTEEKPEIFTKPNKILPASTAPTERDLEAIQKMENRRRAGGYVPASPHSTTQLTAHFTAKKEIGIEITIPFPYPSSEPIGMAINVGIGIINGFFALTKKNKMEHRNKEAGAIKQRLDEFDKLLGEINKRFGTLITPNGISGQNVLNELQKIDKLIKTLADKSFYDREKIKSHKHALKITDTHETELNTFYTSSVVNCRNVLKEFEINSRITTINVKYLDSIQNYKDLYGKVTVHLNNILSGKGSDIAKHTASLLELQESDDQRNYQKNINDLMKDINEASSLLTTNDEVQEGLKATLKNVLQQREDLNLLFALPKVTPEQLDKTRPTLVSLNTPGESLPYLAQMVFLAQVEMVKENYQSSLQAIKKLMNTFGSIERKLLDSELSVLNHTVSLFYNANQLTQSQASLEDITIIKKLIQSNSDFDTKHLIECVSYLYFQSSYGLSNQAVKWYKDCAEKDPLNPDWETFLAYADFVNFEWSSTEAHLAKAKKAKPDDLRTKQLIGLVAYHKFKIAGFMSECFCMAIMPSIQWLADKNFISSKTSEVSQAIVSFTSLPAIHQNLLLMLWPQHSKAELRDFLIKNEQIYQFDSWLSNALILSSTLNVIKPFVSEEISNGISLGQTAVDATYRLSATYGLATQLLNQERTASSLTRMIDSGMNILSIMNHVSALTTYAGPVERYFNQGMRFENRGLLAVEAFHSTYLAKMLSLDVFLKSNSFVMNTLYDLIDYGISNCTSPTSGIYSSVLTGTNPLATLLSTSIAKVTIPVITAGLLIYDVYYMYWATRFNRLLDNGNQLLSEEKYQTALEKYKEASECSFDKKTVDFKIALAKCKALLPPRDGNGQDGPLNEENLKQVIAICAAQNIQEADSFSLKEPLYYISAHCKMRLGTLDDARTDLDEIVKHSSFPADAHALLAYISLEFGASQNKEKPSTFPDFDARLEALKHYSAALCSYKKLETVLIEKSLDLASIKTVIAKNEESIQKLLVSLDEMLEAIFNAQKKNIKGLLLPHTLISGFQDPLNAVINANFLNLKLALNKRITIFKVDLPADILDKICKSMERYCNQAVKSCQNSANNQHFLYAIAMGLLLPRIKQRFDFYETFKKLFGTDQSLDDSEEIREKLQQYDYNISTMIPQLKVLVDEKFSDRIAQYLQSQKVRINSRTPQRTLDKNSDVRNGQLEIIAASCLLDCTIDVYLKIAEDKIEKLSVQHKETAERPIIKLLYHPDSSHYTLLLDDSLQRLITYLQDNQSENKYRMGIEKKIDESIHWLFKNSPSYLLSSHSDQDDTRRFLSDITEMFNSIAEDQIKHPDLFTAAFPEYFITTLSRKINYAKSSEIPSLQFFYLSAKVVIHSLENMEREFRPINLIQKLTNLVSSRPIEPPTISTTFLEHKPSRPSFFAKGYSTLVRSMDRFDPNEKPAYLEEYFSKNPAVQKHIKRLFEYGHSIEHLFQYLAESQWLKESCEALILLYKELLEVPYIQNKLKSYVENKPEVTSRSFYFKDLLFKKIRSCQQKWQQLTAQYETIIGVFKLISSVNYADAVDLVESHLGILHPSKLDLLSLSNHQLFWDKLKNQAELSISEEKIVNLLKHFNSQPSILSHNIKFLLQSLMTWEENIKKRQYGQRQLTQSTLTHKDLQLECSTDDSREQLLETMLKTTMNEIQLSMSSTIESTKIACEEKRPETNSLMNNNLSRQPRGECSLRHRNNFFQSMRNSSVDETRDGDFTAKTSNPPKRRCTSSAKVHPKI